MSRSPASSRDRTALPPAPPTPRAVLERSHPTVLGQLFELGRGDAFDWTSAERGGLLRHQLDLPLGPAPGPAPGADVGDQAADEPATGPDGWEARTHRELFAAEDPPLDRLRVIKSRAKHGINAAALDDADGQLPREVATVVYYAALAAARVNAETSITQLDDAAFRTGLHWALDLAWVDEPVRGLLTAALKAATDTSPAGEP